MDKLPRYEIRNYLNGHLGWASTHFDALLIAKSDGKRETYIWDSADIERRVEFPNR